jgi:hypothetical protein
VIFGLAVKTLASQESWFISALLQAIRVLAKFFIFKMPLVRVAAPFIVLQPALIETLLLSKRIVIGSVDANFFAFLLKVTEVDLNVSASTSEKLINFDFADAATADSAIEYELEENDIGNETGRTIGTIARSATAINRLLLLVFIFSFSRIFDY